MDFSSEQSQTIVQGGAVGLALIVILILGYAVKEMLRLVGNHMVHLMQEQGVMVAKMENVGDQLERVGSRMEQVLDEIRVERRTKVEVESPKQPGDPTKVHITQ